MSRFRRRLMGLAALRQAAADDFVRVEYIENTSNAYIDTLIKPIANRRYVLDCAFTSTDSLQQNGCMQDLGNGTYNRCHFGIRSNLTDFQGCLQRSIYNWQPLDTNRHIWEIGYRNVKFDESIKGTTANDNYLPDVTFCLFARKTNNSVADFCLQRVYSFKIYNGDLLVRDFIPMYQKSKDTYGLWDRVKEEFYTSPNGVKFIGGERYDTTDIIEVHPKLIANTYINENSGAQQNYGGWSSSDYIDVEGFNYIYVQFPFPQSNYKYGAYYDKDKRRISNTSSFVIPSNAKYVRLSTTTASFSNVWMFKRQLTTTDIYRANSYIDTNGSIRAYNGWNIFNTESVYNYYYCWIYSQSYRYQASYNADGSVYQSGKGFLERPEGGKVLLSDRNTSITYYAGYNYEYKNMNE